MPDLDHLCSQDAALRGHKPKAGDVNDLLTRAAARVIREREERDNARDDVGDYVLSGAKLDAIMAIRARLDGNVFADLIVDNISRELAQGRLKPEKAMETAEEKLEEYEDAARILKGEH